MEGWGQVRSAAKYAGVGERKFRALLKAGLRHSRLPSGLILVKFSDIDEYFARFANEPNSIDRLVDETLKDVGLEG